MQSTAAITPRAFGSEPGDLSLDFDTMPPPGLATHLIRACTGIEEATAWRLTVGERLRLILAIVARGDGRDFAVELTCPKCETVSETEWTIDEILEALPEPAAVLHVEAGGRAVRLRLPTGEDQVSWLARSFASEEEAGLFVLRSLIVDEEMPDREFLQRLVTTAEAALEQADPLVHFQILSPCPECGVEMTQVVDWTEYAFRRFREAQQRLVGKIHRLASRYHWSEAEIFAVPAWRRDLYLAVIAGEGD